MYNLLLLKMASSHSGLFVPSSKDEVPGSSLECSLTQQCAGMCALDLSQHTSPSLCHLIIILITICFYTQNIISY